MPIWYCKTCYTIFDPDDIGPLGEELGLPILSENKVATPPCPYCSTPLLWDIVLPWDNPDGIKLENKLKIKA